ncbi:major facilitator superfamily domain-containing protein [Kockovaella imperatae]|uniref:Major facilitator superfamily domain-containing protein n=1 Tax=Kockovaella imperatae TaxID=4999 RepID=A0A1Y1UP74_9TREE|nr:major facilitator superfamily domain-containing protein [Kockovaella imperatae]ORX39833.1 major facilitator superfamily domain-containing protein [Kockovaella imperatae]
MPAALSFRDSAGDSRSTLNIMPVTLSQTDDPEVTKQQPDVKPLPVSSSLTSGSTTTVNDGPVIQTKSKGVVEMENLIGRLSPFLLIIIYGSFMLLSYTLSLNQYTASYFLNIATSESFNQHSLQASVTTIAAVFQAMAQPPIAKMADAFGRVPAEAACVILYVLGNVIIASSRSIVDYAVGDCIYQLGITGLFLLQNIIIADISSLRNRYFWTIFPSIPQVINAFVSANIVDSLLNRGPNTTQWRWGFGIFTILIPVVAIPILVTLWWGTRSSKGERTAAETSSAGPKRPIRKHLWRGAVSLFWQLDFMGLLLFVVGFGLLFVTLTLANSQTAHWSDAHSIVQLVIGAIVIVAFVLWERYYAPHPLLPFALLKRKTVIGCCLIALWHPMAGTISAGYLTTFLQVAAGQSVISTQRITSFPAVAGWICAIVGAWVARRFRVLKPIIIAGAAIETLAIGLMIRYRTSTNTQAELAVVQLIRGAANGLIPYPVQALIQASAPHEHLGAITAGWLVVYYLAGGIGSAIGGAMWTNIVPRKLGQYLGGNDTLIEMAYANPFGYAAQFPMGTTERTAISRAQDEAQRTMVIVGTIVAFIGLVTSIFMLDNWKLTDEQSLKESEDLVEEGVQASRFKKRNAA